MPIAPATKLAAMELLEAALDLPVDDQENFIKNHPGSDHKTISYALELLKEDRHSLSALQTGGAQDLSEDDDVKPERIGAYRILRLLGRGGMGAVYLGERASDDFDHVVAIKLIKQALVSDSLIDRFQRERQILAGLKHPHIAHLYDGGETEDGSPYIVMEYVDGISLTEWIETQRPDLDRRLRLFMQICDAVEFAHQNLVIHRDLTPSNVLITQGDQAKLIDFGISRPHADGQTGDSPSTFSGLSLTPGFAAPERSEGTTTNTLSDIYSLGRILDILVKPYDQPELAAIAQQAASIDPDDRYQTARGLVIDITNFRENQPVSAFSGQKRYRVRKFISRQKLAVGTTAGVIILLLAGLGGTGWAYNRAEIARHDAEDRFAQVRELASFMLFDLYDDLQPIPGNTKALSKIADKSRFYLDALNRDGRASLPLQIEIAQGYKRLADVMGNPKGANLGRREESGLLLEKAFDQLAALHKANPSNIAATRALAEAAYAFSTHKFVADNEEEASGNLARLSASLYQEIIDRGQAGKSDLVNQLKAKQQEAGIYVWEERGAEGLAAFEKLRKQVATLAQKYPDDYAVQSLIASVDTDYANTMGWHFDVVGGDYNVPLKIASGAIDKYRELDRKYPGDRRARRNLVSAYYKRGQLIYGLEDWRALIADLERSRDLAQEILDRDPNDSSMERMIQASQGQMVPVLGYLGQFDRAIQLGKKNHARRLALYEGDKENPGRFRDLTYSLFSQASIMDSAGRKKEACDYYRQSSENWKIIEKRWNISKLDRENAVKEINLKLTEC
jgi:predicted Ser/Thr protein kinase